MNAQLLPQLQGELWKLFARRRTYIGFGVYLAMEVLILLLLQLPKVQRGMRNVIENSGYGFEQYYSGLTLGFMVVSSTVIIFAPIFLALISGDVVSKEVEDGTMRMILSRPVSRLRVLLVRYFAAVIYTFALVAFITGSALLVGFLKQGFGDAFIYAPGQHIAAFYSFWPGLQRFLLAIPLMAASFLTATSLGFLFSCCNMKPAAATVLCIAIYFVDMILHGFPQFENIREWFVTTHILTWMNIFRTSVPVAEMVQDYAFLFGVDATLFVLGALIFQTRDFKA